ncbi:MAG: hypothetical protein VX085_07975 [Pseudomonadota bacterium]|nr:hypothetical protein [Pseudomonadota bacterium]
MSERAGDDRIRPTGYSNTLVHLREAFSPVDHARIFDLMSFTADTKSMPLLGSSEINDTLQAGDITRSRACAIMQHRVQEWHKHSGARLNVVLRLLSASKIGIAFKKLPGTRHGLFWISREPPSNDKSTAVSAVSTCLGTPICAPLIITTL